jgi:hypothetical protein
VSFAPWIGIEKRARLQQFSPISTAAHLDEHIIANACFHCLCHLETCIGLESSVLGHVL